jgi:hypothetical protein
MDLLRQPLDGSVRSRLEARKQTHLRMRGGGSDPTGDQKRRLPAWARITIPGTDAPPIEANLQGYEGRYRAGSDNRPRDASLKSLSIQRVTGKAETFNLTLEINVEFEVFNFDDFEVFASAYLRRSPERKPIKIEWGNGSTFGGRGQVSHSIEGALLISGGYSNTELNTYVCRFNAIGPAQAVSNLDVLSCDLMHLFKNQRFIYGEGAVFSATERVSNLINKIVYDLQQGGKTRTDDVDQGTEPISPGMNNGKPVGKIYKKFQEGGIFNIKNAFDNMTNRSEEKTGVGSDMHEYISLEYIVDLINKTIVKVTNTKCNDKLSYEIVFDEKPYSYVPTKKLGNKFRSADPVSVLFLDGSNSGNYKNNWISGKNFEIGGSYFSDCVNVSDQTINHKKILISRKIVATYLSDKLEKVNESREDSKRVKRDRIDRINDVTLSIAEFFQFIFARISRSSGNYVNLAFVFPDITKNKNEEMHKIIITDVFGVSEPKPEYFELDPFTGDGNCLSLVVEGKTPSDMVDLAIIAGVGEGSGTAARLSEEQDYQQSVQDEYNTIVKKLTSTDEDFGVFAQMAKKDFSEDTIGDACSTLAEFKKIDNALCVVLDDMPKPFTFTEYFALEMKVEMEGVFPIIAGNVFTSTNLPKFAKPSNGMAFVALDIEDKIEAPGVWTTYISTRAVPYL